MKLCKFIFDGKNYCGVLKNDVIYIINESDLFGNISINGYSINADKVKYLCPTEPGNIFAVGLNYKKHAEEMKMELPSEPLMFIKSVSSLTAHEANIIKPVQTNELSCEAELAIVVKSRCKNITIECAREYILGYSIINDVTARDIQRNESQWARAKSFDTFCPYGPVVETDIEKVTGGIKLYVDKKLVQNSSLQDMIFSPEEILSYVSNQCTLNAGDIIATGTPSGVTTVFPGQRVTVEIENIGKLCNMVVSGDEQND